MTNRPCVGVIGLGSMGMGVARTLLAKGFDTHAFDVRKEALDTFEKAGGTSHSTPASLGAKTGVVIILVVNAGQTDTVLFGHRHQGLPAREQCGDGLEIQDD